MSKIKGNNIEIENALSINGIPINLLGGGGSGEAQSYITTGRSAESVGDLSAWTIYSNTPGVNPVNGFGGSPNITLTRNTTNPLSGLGDFRITKDAVNRQGQGISIPFTVDNRHLARVLQISFDYETISGILGQDNVRVSIIGDPNGTPFLIEPVNTSIEFPTIGNRSKHIATFQTNFSVKEYRLCIHISSTTTEAFVISFNNFRVWEQDQNYGAIITDWVSYTPIFNNSLNATNVAFYFRRVGSNLEIKGKFTTPSNTSSNTGDADISLPTGLTISTNVPSGVNLFGHIATSYTLYNDFAVSGITGSNWLKLRMFNTSGANPLNSSGTWSAVFQNSIDISLQASVPITGWGSNIALSSDAGDGRQVSVLVHGNINTGANVSVNFTWSSPTVAKDTHDSFDATLGFKAPYAGLYGFSGLFNTDLTTIGLATCIDGTITPYPIAISNTFGYFIFSGQIYLKAGQYLTFRPTYSGVSAVGAGNNLSIYSINNSNQIIASNETVAMTAQKDSGSIAANSTVTSYTGLVFDTHNSFNLTTGLYTIPMSGIYYVSFYFEPNNYWVPPETKAIEIRKVGSVTILGRSAFYWNSGSSIFQGSLSASVAIRCIAGEQLHCYNPFSTWSTQVGRFSIARIGI